VDGETGIIVPAHEDQALIDAVLQICETPQRLAMMKLNARKYMENRSFEDAFNQNWEMYHAKPAVEKPSPDNVAQWFKFAS